MDGLAAQDSGGLTDGVRAEQVLRLRRLLDRLEGHWLRDLAAVDADGAAGADQGQPVGSTAAWLRNRLRMGAGAASSWVRTGRALFRGPLPETARALTEGAISPAHAAVLAQGTQDLPDHVAVEAEPVLVEAARRLDPPRLRKVLGHLRVVADPDNEPDRAERRHQRRGLWLAPTWEGMVAIEGLLGAEAGQSLLAALEPLARPANADDSRSGGQRQADALAELARRNLEGGRLPKTGGVRPQLLVTVDLDSLLGHPGTLGGDAGWLVMGRFPSCWSAALPARWRSAARARDWVRGCGRRWRCCRRCWAGHPASPWTSAGPAGSSSPPNGPPWWCVTGAVCSPIVTGR